MTSIGAGYKIESQESRALASITTDSYDYRDQGKLLTKLTGDVSYLAQYSRQMQKGIDAANATFVEQIMEFINEITTVIGGLGNTGVDLGDLKYVLQAIGALFGFDSETGIAGILPINLIDAAWHFVKTYVLGTNAETPGEYFDWLIDQILTTALDWLGEVPLVGGAVETIAMWVTQFRDVIKATTQLLLSWSTPILEMIKNGVDLFNQIFGAWTEPIAAWVYDSISWLTGIFGDWTAAIVNWVYDSISWLVEIFGGWTGPFVTWISNSLTGLMEIFGEWSVAIATWVRETLTWLGNLFYEWTLPFVTWLTDTVGFLGDIFADWSAAIVQWVYESVTWLSNLLAEWTAPFVTAINSVVSFVQDAFGDWSASIATWIHDSVSFLTDMFEAWDGPFADMVKGAIAAIQQIVDWFTGTVGAAFEMLFPWAKKLPQMQIVNGQEVLKTTNVPSLDASKVTTGTLNSALIGDGTLGSGKLADGAVTAPKLSDYAVGTTKLADYAISNTKLGTDAIDTRTIAPNAITGTEIANYAVGTNQIANDAIGTNQIAADAVTTSEIATNAVTNTELAGNSVATANIQNLAVTGGKTTALDGSKINSGTIPVAVIPTAAIGKELTTVGSGGMLTRSTAAVQAVSQGVNIVPSGFFNAPGTISGDITNLSGTGFRVSLGGWYMVEIAYRLNAVASWGWNLAPVLFVNGGAAKFGTDCMYTWGGIPIPTSSGSQRYVQNSFIVSLGVNGTVQAGYNCQMGLNFGDTNVLGGGAGSDTYMSVSLLNRSYA